MTLRSLQQELDSQPLTPPGLRLDADTKPVTLCYGLRGSDAAYNFDALKAKWLATTDANSRAELLAALACAKEDKLTGYEGFSQSEMGICET